ncbi:MAG TPA: tetratricopeptide repeat protein [Xanthobacteraceae bacterium]|nr:tetratricopeptide repeat protein [Xanthobacteraceae bacterium]
MNTFSRLIIAGALMSPLLAPLTLAAPAFAATRQAHEDCDADDPDRNIAGCTRIIDDIGEGAKMRSIALVGRGLAYDAKGDRERAGQDFTAAIALDPKNVLAYNDRAILWREKGDPDRAIVDFTRAIEIEALPHSDLPGSGHVNIYANRGLAWQAKGDLDRALADFDAAIKLDPADASLHEIRASILMERHQDARALPDLDAAIRLNPSRADNFATRGMIRYDQYAHNSRWVEQRDLDGAISDLTEAVTLDPTNADAYYTRGLAFVMDGKRDLAAADFARAAKLKPDDAQIARMHKQYMPRSGGPSGALAAGK